MSEADKTSSSEPGAGTSSKSREEPRLTFDEQLTAMSSWNRAFFFRESSDKGDLVLIASKNINITESIKQEVAGAFDSYDAVMAKGITIGKDLFEVHRIVDCLVYGRRGMPQKNESEGFCIYKHSGSGLDKVVYAIITYELPAISAQEIPRLKEFCQKYCALFGIS